VLYRLQRATVVHIHLVAVVLAHLAALVHAQHVATYAAPCEEKLDKESAFSYLLYWPVVADVKPTLVPLAFVGRLIDKT